MNKNKGKSPVKKGKAQTGWLVSAKDNGSKVPNFIAQQLKNQDISLRQIKASMERGSCLVNDKIEKFASRKLKTGDRVVYQMVKELPKSQKIQLDESVILYEDKDFFICNKPAGISSAPTSNPQQIHFLKILKQAFPERAGKLFMVHRLDKDTSGTIIYTKNQEAQKKLLEDFKEKKVQKVYLALVDGNLEKQEGLIETRMFLASAQKGSEVWSTIPQKNQKSRSAMTHYQVKEKFSDKACLVELKPITGRTHQIRVHMSSIGHPLLGDQLYGKNFKNNLVLPFHLLHSSQIIFNHPSTGKTTQVKAPLPDIFNQTIQKLKKE